MKKKLFVTIIALLTLVTLLVIGTGCNKYLKSATKNDTEITVIFKEAPHDGYYLLVERDNSFSLSDCIYTQTSSNKLKYTFPNKFGSDAVRISYRVEPFRGDSEIEYLIIQ